MVAAASRGEGRSEMQRLQLGGSSGPTDARPTRLHSMISCSEPQCRA